MIRKIAQVLFLVGFAGITFVSVAMSLREPTGSPWPMLNLIFYLLVFSSAWGLDFREEEPS